MQKETANKQGTYCFVFEIITGEYGDCFVVGEVETFRCKIMPPSSVYGNKVATQLPGYVVPHLLHLISSLLWDLTLPILVVTLPTFRDMSVTNQFTLRNI